MAYFTYETALPSVMLAPYIKCFWQMRNNNEENKNAVILPDGNIDVIFSQSSIDPFHANLMGISTKPEEIMLESGLVLFGISFKIAAVEYILQKPVAELINTAIKLPEDFWGLKSSDIVSFKRWCQKVSSLIVPVIPANPDQRKLKLFDLIYSTNGGLTISKYADTAGWASRQINRYFNQQFGLSLKTYCEVLRFQASMEHIQDGKLHPQENYADQSHFIREIKKLSGVSPKNLYRNEHHRYIQLLVPPIS